MSDIGFSGGSQDPWQQLSGRSSKLRVPNRAVLTRNVPFGRHRPAPEVIEHMLDDLEERMRNYFTLYNRERELRRQSEATAYRLEQELVEERRKLAEANTQIEHLDGKIRALVGQPLKIRSTIDKIELLYNQLDTLVQAFVGIGSCATLQSQNRAAFLRLFLEYLYPCRDLDVRLNTLYTAIYASMPHVGNALDQQPLPTPAAPAPAPMPSSTEPATPSAQLRGLSVTVHQLMLKSSKFTNETGYYSCAFRYDNETAEFALSTPSRVMKVTARPMDNASGVIEVDGCVSVQQLPPRIPNVLPMLILDVYSGNVLLGSCQMSIVDNRTLNSREPWQIMDAGGNHCGDLIVSVRGIPDGAKLPAVNFIRRTDELMMSQVPPADANKPSQLEPTVPDKVSAAAPATNKAPSVSKPEVKSKLPPTRATAPPSTPADSPFQPKQKAVLRKPLFLKSNKPTPLGAPAKAAPASTEPAAAAAKSPAPSKAAAPSDAAPKATPSITKAPLLGKSSLPQAADSKAKSPAPEAAASKALPTKAAPMVASKSNASADSTPQPDTAPATPKVGLKAPLGKALLTPKVTFKTPLTTKAEPPSVATKAATKSLATPTKAPVTPTKALATPTKALATPTKAPVTPTKAPATATPEPAEAPAPAPAAAPKAEFVPAKKAPLLAPKGVSKAPLGIAPKTAPTTDAATPKTAPTTDAAAPKAIVPKVATKSAPAADTPAAKEPAAVTKGPLIAPKGKTLGVAAKTALPLLAPKTAAPAVAPKTADGGISPKNAMKSIAPKVALPAVTPKTAPAGITPKVAPPPQPAGSGDAPAGADDKKPLVPIAIKPKFQLKKPLAVKKA
ncbi:hypothetical protein, conserved [Babesia bigemina]|uniref:Uncharacterized protein n=1 Tax=Babesia bigemina TaxID=5866 RepID=A0A061DE62_BABBI|nr:hypothetical protein, conserved [Babesia bigemina]CDR96855.1 hypothetical protein, conserved [Babesia bigemina]|eukprot:XP_012769041.1 hypothetical protein, conserved [Babesia bigemina]